MNLQSVPSILGVVAVASFSAAAVLYYALKKTQPFREWFRARARTRAAAAVAAAERAADKAFAKAAERVTKKPAHLPSGDVSNALKTKRREEANDRPGALMKILEKQIEKVHKQQVLEAKPRPALPPPPSRRVADALSEIANDEPVKTGTALEALVVKMYEDYIAEIAAFQRQLSEATSVGEILNKTCRAVSGFSRKTRVVYLEYQAPQRALMVGSRSGPEVFAGTQPKMFLPLKGTGKSIAAEELRDLFAKLPQDSELQRLLKDSCLLESRAQTNSDPDALWAAQTAWRIYPFYVRGMPQGAFAIQENSVCQRREYNSLVEIFLLQAASSVENIRLHSKMVDVSAKDSVTGLHSRKVFGERLQENYLVARRLQHPLTVLRLDIDHMPAYVKKYGSSVSEAILRHVTRHLDRHFRKSDIVARFGQDGFSILMPHTALVDALKKIEQVVQSVRDSSLKLGRQDTAIEIKVSVSAGVSEFPSHADNPADLLRFASEALFRAQAGTLGGVTLAKVPTGYVPPFNSRFVRSAPKALHDSVPSPILDS